MAFPVTPQFPRQNPLFKQYWTNGRKDIGIYGDHYSPGKYFSPRDINLLGSINAELMGDVIECVIQFFKISAEQTDTNVYGESKSETGKIFSPGVNLTCRAQRDDINTENKNFGPDRNQNMVFMFMQRDCVVTNIYFQTGDLILYNERFYECDNVVEENFLGGHPDKSWDLIVHAHYSRLSRLNVVVRS